MSFVIEWPEFSKSFIDSAKIQLTQALNKGKKPENIVGFIHTNDLSMGSIPPELEILEVGELEEDRFRGIFKLTYSGDASIVLETKVQANPLKAPQHQISITKNIFPNNKMLNANLPLVLPMQLRISNLKLRGIIVLVVDKIKGVTLVFKNDPLEKVDVNSTFDNISNIRRFLQKQIEGQLRKMFQDDLPQLIHNLSLLMISEKEKQLAAESNSKILHSNTPKNISCCSEHSPIDMASTLSYQDSGYYSEGRSSWSNQHKSTPSEYSAFSPQSTTSHITSLPSISSSIYPTTHTIPTAVSKQDAKYWRDLANKPHHQKWIGNEDNSPFFNDDDNGFVLYKNLFELVIDPELAEPSIINIMYHPDGLYAHQDLIVCKETTSICGGFFGGYNAFVSNSNKQSSFFGHTTGTLNSPSFMFNTRIDSDDIYNRNPYLIFGASRTHQYCQQNVEVGEKLINHSICSSPRSVPFELDESSNIDEEDVVEDPSALSSIWSSQMDLRQQPNTIRKRNFRSSQSKLTQHVSNNTSYNETNAKISQSLPNLQTQKQSYPRKSLSTSSFSPVDENISPLSTEAVYGDYHPIHYHPYHPTNHTDTEDEEEDENLYFSDNEETTEEITKFLRNNKTVRIKRGRNYSSRTTVLGERKPHRIRKIVDDAEFNPSVNPCASHLTNLFNSNHTLSMLCGDVHKNARFFAFKSSPKLLKIDEEGRVSRIEEVVFSRKRFAVERKVVGSIRIGK